MQFTTLAAAEAAHAEATSAELNAQSSSSRLGADIASLREELRKVSNYRRAVAAQLCTVSGADGSGAKGDAAQSDVDLTRAERVDRRNFWGRTHRSTGSLSPPVASHAIEESASPARARNKRRGRSILLDDSDDEELANQREADQVQDRADEAQRRMEMEQVQQELAALQQECAAAAQRASRARAELEHSEEGCAESKSALLSRLATFDGVVATLRGQHCVDNPVLSLSASKQGPGHSSASWHSNMVKQYQKRWDINQKWDFKLFARELRTRLTDSGGIFSELEEVRSRESAMNLAGTKLQDELAEEEQCAQQLQATLSREQQVLRRAAASSDKAIQELHDQLDSEEAACKHASLRLATQQGNLAGILDSTELQAARLESRAHMLSQEARELAGQVADENLQLQRAAALAPKRDALLDELEQRDAAAWDLNRQLVNVWREEEAATAHVNGEKQVEEMLRDEIRSEQDATLALERQEKRYHEEVAQIVDRMAIKKVPEGLARINDIGSADLWSLCRDHLSTASAPVAREIEELEAEMQALARDEVSTAQSPLAIELQNMRDRLREENAEYRLEMAEARQLTIPRHAGVPERAGTSSPGSSGFDLALRAWDNILGE